MKKILASLKAGPRKLLEMEKLMCGKEGESSRGAGGGRWGKLKICNVEMHVEKLKWSQHALKKNVCMYICVYIFINRWMRACMHSATIYWQLLFSECSPVQNHAGYLPLRPVSLGRYLDLLKSYYVFGISPMYVAIHFVRHIHPSIGQTLLKCRRSL